MKSAYRLSITIFSIIILVFAQVHVVAQCLPAGAYTIDATQPASATNFQSFNAAVTAMACGIQGGVTFTVAYGSGPYNEQVTIPPITGAGPNARVVFDGQHADSSLLTHDGSAKFATLLLNGADFVTITNLTVQSTSAGAGYGIQLTATADSNIIKKVTVLHDVATVNTQAYGIVASASQTSATSEGNNANHLLIDSVTIVGGFGGIRIEGIAASLLKRNRITNCNISKTYSLGILTDDADSLIIRNNVIKDLRDSGADGINITDARGYFEVSGNQAYASKWALSINNGNLLNLASRAQVVNNFLYSSGSYGLFMINNDRVNVFHNTVVGTVAARFATNSKFLDVRNNIFYATLSFAIEDVVATATSLHLNYDYNIYYSPGPNFVAYGGAATTYANLAAWQAAVPGFNQNSIQGEPVFASINSDLHLLDTLANNKGDNSIGILNDVDGDARPLTPATRVDIGADEYNPYSINLYTVAFATPVPADCGDSTASVAVVIYNQSTTPLSGFDVAVQVTGPNGVQNLSTTYTATLAPWSFDTVAVGSINTYSGGIFNFFAEHLLATDEYTANDTLSINIHLLGNAGLPVAVGDTGCVGQVLELSASGSSFLSLEWYSDAALTNNIGTGSTYFTPALSSTQTYYVAGQQGLKERVGKVAPAGSPTNFVSTTAGWGMEFIVTRTILLDSVTMYPLGTGDFTIGIHQSNGSLVFNTAPISVVGGNSTARQYPVGAMLAPGKYTIGLLDTSAVTFLRESSGGGSPYITSSGFLEITGGKQGFPLVPSVNLYYWFYDWVVSTPSCMSAAVPVVAFVSDSIADAGADTTICLGGTALLAAGNGTDWLWSTGDATQSAPVSPTGPTTYSLTVTDANGCTSRAGQVTVNVNALPTITTNNDTTVCDGALVPLQANGAVTYLWSTTQTGASINVTTADSYVVTGTDANGCTASDTVIVAVNTLPNVTTNADTAICDGQSVDLAANGAATYLWSNAQTGANINVTTADSYVVTGTDANGCAASDTVIVAVNSLPNVTTNADTAICDGQSVDLVANGATTYLWSTTQTGTNINVTTADSYVVTGTDANGCAASDTVTVAVNSLPNVTTNADTAICDGQSVDLVANGATSYLWSNAQTGANINVTTADSYVVTGTDANGCAASDTVVVIVNALPVADAGADQAICEGGTAFLVASGGATYVWDINENTADIEVSPVSTTTYVVTVTNQASCFDTDSVTVTVNSLPLVTLTLGDTLCQELGEVSLVASPTGGTFLGAGVVDSVLNLSLLAPGNSYTVSYTYTDGNQCSNDNTVTYFMDVCQGIGEVATLPELTVFPNPFNSQIYLSFDAVETNRVSIVLYNVLGQQVYSESLEVTSGSTEHALTVGENWAPGVYVLEVRQGMQSFRQQLLHLK